MKVLYLSYDGMTDNLGQSQVIPYLAGLSAKEYEISLISCEKSDRFSKQGERIRALLRESGIKWHPIPYRIFPPVFSRFLNVYDMYRKALQLFKQDRFEIVHCRSYMAALAGERLKRKFDSRFLFDMRGFWADERVDGNIWNLSKPLHRRLFHYFKRKEAAFLRTSDAIVSLTAAGKKQIHEWNANLDKSKVAVIPCCADNHLFDPHAVSNAVKENLRQEHKLGAKFILSYLGSIGTWYMLPEMLAFFKELLKSKPDAVFLIISPDDPNQILAESRSLEIPDQSIRIISAARQEVPALLSLSNLSIFFIKPAFSKKASSPTKLAEIMLMGIPFVTNSGVGDVDDIIAATGAGLLVRDFSPASYREQISRLDDLLEKDTSAFRQYAREQFGIRRGVDLYHALYQQMTTVGQSTTNR